MKYEYFSFLNFSSVLLMSTSFVVVFLYCSNDFVIVNIEFLGISTFALARFSEAVDCAAQLLSEKPIKLFVHICSDITVLLILVLM